MGGMQHVLAVAVTNVAYSNICCYTASNRYNTTGANARNTQNKLPKPVVRSILTLNKITLINYYTPSLTM